MSELLAAAFDSEDLARRAYDEVMVAWTRAEAGLFGVAFVTADESGEIDVESPRSAVKSADAVVAPVVFGAFVGALFTVPVVGIALGGVTAAVAALTRHSSPLGNVRERITGLISAGHSGVVVFADERTAGAVSARLSDLGGDVVTHPLTAHEAQMLKDFLSQ